MHALYGHLRYLSVSYDYRQMQPNYSKVSKGEIKMIDGRKQEKIIMTTADFGVSLVIYHEGVNSRQTFTKYRDLVCDV